MLVSTIVLILDTSNPRSDDHGEIWARNNVTLRTQEKILDHIKMAYPSVSHVDHVVVATWYNRRHTKYGWVCSYCIALLALGRDPTNTVYILHVLQMCSARLASIFG